MLECGTYYDLTKGSGGGGGTGTSNYNELANLPKVNNVTVKGNLTSTQLGLASQTELDEVRDIAEGAMRAVAFDDYEELVTTLNNTEATEYRTGENFFVRTLNVPDLWVYSVEQTSQPYTYTTDEQFLSDLRATGAIIIGHYVLSELETQKVDLTDYVERTELDDYAKLTDLDNPYWVTYGTTTYAEITEAINAGKQLLCWYNSRLYLYGGIASTYHYFTTTTISSTAYYIRVNASNTWSNSSLGFQLAGNLVKSTSTTAPTDANYYSALAVDNMLQGVEVSNTTDTTATLAVQKAKNYIYTQPLTSLAISSVETSYLETTLTFTAGTGIQVTFPQTLQKVGEPKFEAGKKYIMCFWNNTVVVGEVA